METKIYFYTHNRVNKKDGKSRIYCKLTTEKYKPILLPLKQTPTSKTLSCKAEDLIAKAKVIEAYILGK